MARVNAEMLGDLLLELSRMCYELPIEDFRRESLTAIGQRIGSTVAWWALVNRDKKDFHVHSSCELGLPDGCEELLNTCGDNVIRARCLSAPGHAFIFNRKVLYQCTNLAVLSSHMHIHHLVVIGVGFDHALGQSSFLLFGRREQDLAFTEFDRQLVQLVMPHLIELQRINFLSQIASWRNSHFQYQEGLAVVDSDFVIHAADRIFVRLLIEEWPDWSSPKLPEEMAEIIRSGAMRVDGKRVSGEVFPTGKLLAITLRKRSPIEALRQREREIAMAFAEGKSYKEVARSFSISPATVRHHLRNVYEKLGVSDKAALANLIK